MGVYVPYRKKTISHSTRMCVIVRVSVCVREKVLREVHAEEPSEEAHGDGEGSEQSQEVQNLVALVFADIVLPRVSESDAADSNRLRRCATVSKRPEEGIVVLQSCSSRMRSSTVLYSCD